MASFEATVMDQTIEAEIGKVIESYSFFLVPSASDLPDIISGKQENKVPMITRMILTYQFEVKGLISHYDGIEVKVIIIDKNGNENEVIRETLSYYRSSRSGEKDVTNIMGGAPSPFGVNTLKIIVRAYGIGAGRTIPVGIKIGVYGTWGW